MTTLTQAAAMPVRHTLLGHVAQTLRLALPVMASRAGILVLTVVDSIMTGRAGADQLAYYAIGMAPQMLMLLVGIGLLMGTVVLTAQAEGAGRSQDCGAVWRIALIHAIGYGLVLFALSYGGETFLGLVGQAPDLARGGAAVLIAFGWSMPAMLMYVATTLFLEGIHRPVPSLLVMFLANLLNVFLNWLLIYGHWGLPALGAHGAALATTLVRWFMFLAIAAYVLLAVDRTRYGIGNPLREPWVLLARKFRRIGYPMALSQGLESGAFASMTLLAGLLGPLQVAAFQISMTLLALVFMCALGFAIAASVRVGNAVGRRDQPGIRWAGWVAAGLAVIVLSAIALLFHSIPQRLAAVYTSDPAVTAIAALAVGTAALVLIPDGLQAVLMGALRGTADVWPAILLFIISFWLVMVPAAYVMGVKQAGGAPALVLAIAMGCVTAAVLLAARFHVVSGRAVARF